ncbi:MAG TPA: gamma-glutamyl-gamma-aminobutyrate hydrolase family protein [Longimicrobiales bacterium]|nr:gamma-glutamyl-gamma-aminobutyrate hydrolase family protein [Longimicrobiales bacterium]
MNGPAGHSAPRVALTTTCIDEGGTYQRPAVAIYESYINALEAVGLATVLITPAHSPQAVRALMNACAGLVLSGGEDVDPARYGAEPSPALGSVNRRRDEVEFNALEYALQQQMPVLGICRGAQVINVAMGGTLFQDLATERPGPVLHQQREDWGQRTHCASVVTGSRLHEIVQNEELFINSYHHQAIRDVAPGLSVVARAEDGMVEAVEGRDQPWLVGVQWHPERYEASTPGNDPDRLLFQAFAEVLHGAVAGSEAATGRGFAS